ncbi:hypothetical protein HY450_03430 [Candidatus Pacearchaeota archaeon]|nr:hypothetical protein [Candidatus Pacearchaeota archaeon]
MKEDRKYGVAVALGVGIAVLAGSSYMLGRTHGYVDGIEKSIETLESRVRSVGEQGRYANNIKEQDEILDYCKGLGNAIDVLDELRGEE